MGDQFMVDPAEVARVAGSVAQQQAASGGLGDVLAAGRGADTGDRALNADVEALVADFTEVFGHLTAALDRTSTGLTRIGEGYRNADEAVAGEFRQLGADRPEPTQPDPADTPSV